LGISLITGLIDFKDFSDPYLFYYSPDYKDYYLPFVGVKGRFTSCRGFLGVAGRFFYFVSF